MSWFQRRSSTLFYVADIPWGKEHVKSNPFGGESWTISQERTKKKCHTDCIN